MSNGANKYSGIQRQVAEIALKNAETLPGSSGIERFTRAIIKIRVDEVTPSLEKSSANNCAPSNIISYANYKPDDIEYYAAIVSYRTFFGLSVDSFPIQGCVAR